MRGDRAIYGLQPHGLDGHQKPLDSIETMASAYLREIRKKQANGPYLLGGICLGGVVAYEMAQQLRAAGEAVTLVAMIDSYLPGKLSYLHVRSPLIEYLDRHLGEMLLLPSTKRLKYLARWIVNGGIRFGRAFGFREKSSLAEATRKIAAAHRRAIFSYEAKPYAGEVAHLICSDAACRSYEDRRLAWSALLPAGMSVQFIPGDHHTMVEAPYAQVLARELETCLDRATDAAPSPIRKPNVMMFRMPEARGSRY
jgi:thioesterase domain-containing protein